MTSPSESGDEGQSGSEAELQAGTQPDRSWIEFDLGLRGQDPDGVEHR